MKTTNVISTPDITGNIGSCTSQKIEVTTDYSFFTYQYKNIVTNSCTGAVTEYPAWGISGMSVAIVAILATVFAFALMVRFDN